MEIVINVGDEEPHAKNHRCKHAEQRPCEDNVRAEHHHGVGKGSKESESDDLLVFQAAGDFVVFHLGFCGRNRGDESLLVSGGHCCRRGGDAFEFGVETQHQAENAADQGRKGHRIENRNIGPDPDG
jgi:hypothetical protein